MGQASSLQREVVVRELQLSQVVVCENGYVSLIARRSVSVYR